MGIKWRDFQLPKKVECDEAAYTDTYGKFISEPYEKGFAVTIGNSLRRIILSSVEGSAVTSVKFDGVLHEFSNIPGVLEDVTNIILNIKNLVLRSHSKTPKKIEIKKAVKGDVTAKDIITDETIEIINPNLHIATLTKDIKFSAEMEVARGRGYVLAEQNKQEGQPVGVIPIDSIFNPIKKVNFNVENTRVGQRTDYERLIIEIYTNGSVNPKESMLYGIEILKKHIEVFSGFGQLPEEEIEIEEELTPEEESLYEKLRLPITEVELSVRSSNCLQETNIKTLGDLVRKTEQEMLSLRNFGKKSLTEIKELLVGMGLSLGMQVDTKKLKKKSE